MVIFGSDLNPMLEFLKSNQNLIPFITNYFQMCHKVKIDFLLTFRVTLAPNVT
jgi:hypothetical protein